MPPLKGCGSMSHSSSKPSSRSSENLPRHLHLVQWASRRREYSQGVVGGLPVGSTASDAPGGSTGGTGGPRGMMETWGSWVAGLTSWDWWWTGTFEDSFSVESARRAWLRYSRGLGDGASWVYVVGPHPGGHGAHVHAVVGGVAGLERRAWWKTWFDRYGQCRIVPYRPGASRYLGREMLKHRCWWDVYLSRQLVLAREVSR